jgi:hypothetical protein
LEQGKRVFDSNRANEASLNANEAIRQQPPRRVPHQVGFKPLTEARGGGAKDQTLLIIENETIHALFVKDMVWTIIDLL